MNFTVFLVVVGFVVGFITSAIFLEDYINNKK